MRGLFCIRWALLVAKSSIEAREKPPSKREVASPKGLTEGAWSFTVSSAVKVYARRTPSVSTYGFDSATRPSPFVNPEVDISPTLLGNRPSRREPYPKLNGGDRKASLSEGGGKPIGLTEGACSLTVGTAVNF